MSHDSSKFSLTGANLIVGDGSDPIRNARVEVENGKITDITIDGCSSGASPSMDLDGRWLLPGLIDSHVHIVLDGGPDQLANYAQYDETYFAFIAAQSIRRSLLSGITTLRDLGGMNGIEFSVRRAARNGLIPGSRLILVGCLVTCTSPGTEEFIGMYRPADGVDEVRKASREQLKLGEWSAYTTLKSHIFQSLPSGDYTFEVRARDGDFNEDTSPAQVLFIVVPPVWQEPWFIGLMALGLIIISLQAFRILNRDKQLKVSNAALSDAMNDLFGVNQDLKTSNSQLKEAQDQLILNEKMASLGSLVAGVAHEINTPVGAASSAADVSRRCIERIAQALEAGVGKLESNPQLQKVLGLLKENNGIVMEAGDRIGQIVKSLRNFARLDESEIQEADLREGIDTTLILIHHETKGRVTVIKEYDDIPSIYCYPTQLNQVFMNLLINAAQAIEGKGEIRIQTLADATHVHVKISDTGSGITPEHLSKIFDPGFTTKGVGVGTGLGLSISYNIIQKHKGHLEVESRPGEGTTFTLSLPRSGIHDKT